MFDKELLFAWDEDTESGLVCQGDFEEFDSGGGVGAPALRREESRGAKASKMAWAGEHGQLLLTWTAFLRTLTC